MSALLECLHSAFAPYRTDYSPGAFRDTTLTPASAHRRLRTMNVWAVVDRGGRVLATLSWVRESPGTAHLRGMAVLPSWQGTGLAQQLLDRVIVEIEREGIGGIALDTTRPLRRAARFYERNGFRRSGRVRDYFGMPLIEYRRDLRARPGDGATRSSPGAEKGRPPRVRSEGPPTRASRAR